MNSYSLIPTYYGSPQKMAELIKHLKAGKASLEEFEKAKVGTSHPEWYRAFRNKLDEELKNGWAPDSIAQFPFYYNTTQTLQYLVDAIKTETVSFEKISKSELSKTHPEWYSDLRKSINRELAHGWVPLSTQWPLFYDAPQLQHLLADKIGTDVPSEDFEAICQSGQHDSWCNEIQALLDKKKTIVNLEPEPEPVPEPKPNEKRQKMPLLIVAIAAISIIGLLATLLFKAYSDKNDLAQTNAISLQNLKKTIGDRDLLMVQCESLKVNIDSLAFENGALQKKNKELQVNEMKGKDQLIVSRMEIEKYKSDIQNLKDYNNKLKKDSSSLRNTIKTLNSSISGKESIINSKESIINSVSKNHPFVITAIKRDGKNLIVYYYGIRPGKYTITRKSLYLPSADGYKFFSKEKDIPVDIKKGNNSFPIERPNSSVDFHMLFLNGIMIGGMSPM